MKVGDKVYLREDSKWNNGSENNPIGRQGTVRAVYGTDANETAVVDWGFSDNIYKSSDLIIASEYDAPVGHPNAAILMDIAKEAAVNPEYWKEFQWYHDIDKIWHSCNTEESLLIAVYEVREFPNQIVRRKPRTIRIGNYDVKKPVNLIAHRGCVSIFVETEEDAELMLKALQELLGSRK